MVWPFKKKSDFLDLTERYKKQQERVDAMKAEQESDSSPAPTGAIGIFGMSTTTSSSSDSGYVDVSSSEDDRKKKLAKRLMIITDKLEELSNQIYHLQQRIEVLEKKNSMGY